MLVVVLRTVQFGARSLFGSLSSVARKVISGDGHHPRQTRDYVTTILGSVMSDMAVIGHTKVTSKGEQASANKIPSYD